MKINSTEKRNYFGNRTQLYKLLEVDHVVQLLLLYIEYLVVVEVLTDRPWDLLKLLVVRDKFYDKDKQLKTKCLNNLSGHTYIHLEELILQ